MIKILTNYMKNRPKINRKQYIGLKLEKIQLTKIQKISLVLAIINIPLPTLSLLTSPIILGIGRKLSIKEKVKLR